LIVDDDRDHVTALRNLLGLHGYEVEIARSADAAKDVARRFDAQVALLDIRLGRSSGLDLIEPLRQPRPGLAFVAMTGYADTDMAVEALRRGAYDFLRKPLHTDELLATLERCFEKLRLEREKQAAEQALLESEQRLATALRQAKLGYWRWSFQEQRIVYWSAGLRDRVSRHARRRRHSPHP
jgi:DNA-binding NtrC family response regulator